MKFICSAAFSVSASLALNVNWYLTCAIDWQSVTVHWCVECNPLQSCCFWSPSCFQWIKKGITSIVYWSIRCFRCVVLSLFHSHLLHFLMLKIVRISYESTCEPLFRDQLDPKLIRLLPIKTGTRTRRSHFGLDFNECNRQSDDQSGRCNLNRSFHCKCNHFIFDHTSSIKKKSNRFTFIVVNF